LWLAGHWEEGIMVRQILITGCVFLCAIATAQAGELVYTPINPAFGGNPLNGNFLLNDAQLQDNYKDPEASSAARSLGTPLEQFNQSLQRTILNRIASALTGNVVDSAGNLIPGSIQTADFMIDIVDLGLGVLQITTTDKATGQSTSFQVSQ
jgi:curli production assembly/transport component CsgF